MVKYLFSLVKKLQLEKRVLFVEHCDDMPAAYLLADIVVSASSSKAEAFGRVAVEAQAMGRPVIATAHGGSIETVLDGRTGWLVKPEDDAAMAGVLREALTDKTLRQNYGANGIAWIKDNFTVRKMCEKTVAVYTDLLKNRHTIG